jgi:hypothetical protein
MAYTDIDKSDDYFTTFLWTGDGASTRSITGVGLQADMMWSKIRNVGHQHNLVDTVRGVNQRLLMTNEAGAEDTTGTQGYFNSLDSDGFSLTYGGAGGYNTNRSGEPYVGWFWKAGGTASSNTNGSITSTVSANTTSGFSIVSYTGTGSNATIGHGLASVPKIIFVKRRNTAENWAVNIQKITNVINDSLWLNLTNASSTIPIWWNSTNQTSSVFSVGTASDVNGSGDTYIAYCFAEKKGFSKFGSYTGNGSTDGPFVYTGFKPAFVIIKSSSQAETNWVIVDNKREGYNPDNDRLFPDSNQAESTSDVIDLLSNGFKLKSGAGSSNGPSYTHIYMAFAENPFVTSSGIPACAR